MNQFNSDNSEQNDCLDENLVSFLQTYSSPPPLETKPCEDLLIRSITTSNLEQKSIGTKKYKIKQLFWLLPITLVSSLMMIFNHLWQQKLSPQIVLDYEEDIHTFMMNSWEDSIVIYDDQEVIDDEQQDSLYLVVTGD